MPSTEEITGVVRSGDGIVRHTDTVYRLNGPDYLRVRTDPVVKLTNAVFSEIQAYYADRRSHPVNYENCCYVVTQLYDTESGEFDNPAVKPLIDKLRQHQELNSLLDSEDKRISLFEEARNYIHDIVWALLSRQPTDYQHLAFLATAARDHDVESLELLTLNHDTVLEWALRENEIAHCDGFGNPVGNIRLWEPTRLSENHRVRVSKLHGSIDWFWFRSKRRVGITLNDDLFDTSGRPELLVGTFNKMHQYTTGIFADLHCHFHQTLRQVRYVICCGYGFGDKGINTKLVEWINSDPSKRLVIVHGNPAPLMDCSRGAISNHWQQWRQAGKLRFVDKWVEQVEWDEIKAASLA
jgi:hypothetical protein